MENAFARGKSHRTSVVPKRPKAARIQDRSCGAEIARVPKRWTNENPMCNFVSTEDSSRPAETSSDLSEKKCLECRRRERSRARAHDTAFSDVEKFSREKEKRSRRGEGLRSAIVRRVRAKVLASFISFFFSFFFGISNDDISQ